MAWGGTTATLHPIQVKEAGGVYLMSTNIGSTKGYADTAVNMFGTTGLLLTTANDVSQIPIHGKEGKIMILAAFGALTTNDVFYPLLMVRKPSESAAIGGGYSTARPAATLGTGMQPSSTNALGWEFMISTASITATTTEAYVACFGPVESRKYSFTNSTFQQYIEVMIPPCTAATRAAAIAAFTAITTAKDSTSIHVMAFELP
jgi:hypothetical protein